MGRMGWVPDEIWYKQKGKGGKGGKGGGVMQVLQALLGGGKGKGKGKGNPSQAMIAQHAKKEPESVVWIGGLDKAIGKEGNKQLKAHVEKLTGTGPKFVNIGPKGEGGAIFGSSAEAQTAIAAVNGTNFQGSTLEFDSW